MHRSAVPRPGAGPDHAAHTVRRRHCRRHPQIHPGPFRPTIADARATVFPLAPPCCRCSANTPTVTPPTWPASAISSTADPRSRSGSRRLAGPRHQMLQGYGMTEASPGVLMALGHGALSRPVSAGVPHFFTDIALRQKTASSSAGPVRENCLSAGRTCSAATGTGRRNRWPPSMEDGSHRGHRARRPDGWAYVVGPGQGHDHLRRGEHLPGRSGSRHRRARRS